jgi:ribosome-binding factor A
MALKGQNRRSAQVSETLRQVIADALLGEIRDPRVGMVTVTSVSVTGDLSQAKVTVAVPGTEEDRQTALEGLRSAAGFFRSKAAKALTTRIVPEIAFDLDRGVEHAARIDALLAEVRGTRQEAGGESSGAGE